MISVEMLTGGPGAGDYYLRRQADCAADYYVGRGESEGVWVGAGAEALGLTGPLGPGGEHVLRAMLAGRAPDGQVLVAAVLRAVPASRLPAGPLVEAVRAVAIGQQLTPSEILPRTPDARYRVLERRMDGPRGATATVGAEDAERLCSAAGLDPVAVFRAADGTDRFSPALAAADGRVDIRRAGIDVTMSAPKSVSVLYGLGSPAVAGQARAAHDAAVAEALRYLSREAGHGLRGHQGDGRRAARIGTDGLIAAGFTHRTSRADDPQLHSHLVIPNVVRGEDGQWSAVDSRAVYRHATTASYLYQATLRAELTRRLGVTWTAPKRGIAEIVGVPAGLRRLFSTRSVQISTELARTGRDGPAAAQVACLATRPAKSHTPEVALRERWQLRAAEAGHPGEQLIDQTVGRQIELPALPTFAEMSDRLVAPTGLTSMQTSVDRRDLLQAVCEELPPGAPVSLELVDAYADATLRSTELVRLAGAAAVVEDGPRWSTAELLATEKHAFTVAATLRAAAPARPIRSIALRGLNGEQAALVRGLLEHTGGLTIVVGPAGAGKTAALKTAVEAWSAAGVPVHGATVAALTARELSRATGMPTTTLTRLLADADRPTADGHPPAGLPAGSVLVVDEAGMVDTRTLVRLLDHAAASRAKLVLVGDPAQLPEIGAGGLFTALTRHPDTIRLQGNQRQHRLWERVALAQLRTGDIAGALDAYEAHGRIHTAPTAVDAQVEIVSDYLALRDQTVHPDRVLMLTSTRADTCELNELTRARLRAHGRLAGPALTVMTADGDVRDFQAGDEVVVIRNDHSRGLLNGTRATVTAVDPHAQWLALTTRDGAGHTVGTDWLQEDRLAHGYALTVHKAQGSTVDHALLYGTGALSQEAGYVALSRGRESNHLYAANPDLDELYAVERQVPDWLADRLEQSARQTLALEQYPDGGSHPDGLFDWLRDDGRGHDLGIGR
ncbi:MAG TPA: MobF family relaxase [Actinomycetales bacterium]|nr:MobF family relaxase [Actinomycetales bacterium]